MKKIGLIIATALTIVFLGIAVFTDGYIFMGGTGFSNEYIIIGSTDNADCGYLRKGIDILLENRNKNGQRISPSEAKKLMRQYPDAIILDVRSTEEFATGRIPGAILLPVDKIKNKASSVLPDKNKLILVYCRSGVRSQTAANHLVLMGYTRVYDFGGINNWPYGTQ